MRHLTIEFAGSPTFPSASFWSEGCTWSVGGLSLVEEGVAFLNIYKPNAEPARDLVASLFESARFEPREPTLKLPLRQIQKILTTRLLMTVYISPEDQLLFSFKCS